MQCAGAGSCSGRTRSRWRLVRHRALQLQSLWRIPAAAVSHDSPWLSWPTAAIPVDNPCRSCKRPRVRPTGVTPLMRRMTRVPGRLAEVAEGQPRSLAEWLEQWGGGGGRRVAGREAAALRRSKFGSLMSSNSKVTGCSAQPCAQLCSAQLCAQLCPGATVLLPLFLLLVVVVVLLLLFVLAVLRLFCRL